MLSDLKNYSGDLFATWKKIDNYVLNNNIYLALFHINNLFERLCRDLYCLIKCVDNIESKMFYDVPLFDKSIKTTVYVDIIEYLYKNKRINLEIYKILNSLRKLRNSYKRTKAETNYITSDDLKEYDENRSKIVSVLLSGINRERLSKFKLLSNNKYKGVFGNSYRHIVEAYVNMRSDPDALLIELYRAIYKVETHIINELGLTPDTDSNYFLLDNTGLSNQKLREVLNSIRIINKKCNYVSHDKKIYKENEIDTVLELSRRIINYLLLYGKDDIDKSLNSNLVEHNHYNAKALYIFEDEEPRVFQLKNSMSFGRNTPRNKNDISTESRIVSRVHGQFEIIGGNCYYCDKGSLNGTYINAKKAEPNSQVKLNNYDILRINSLNGDRVQGSVLMLYVERYDYFKWRELDIGDGFEINNDILINPIENGFALSVSNTREVLINNKNTISSALLKKYDVIRYKEVLLVFMGDYIIVNDAL